MNISKCTKRWKQSSTFKQLLEDLLLTIQKSTGFTADVIRANTKLCSVTREPIQSGADAFRPLSTHQSY